MSLEELLQEVQFVTDGDGQRKAVQLDLELWEKLIAWLHVSLESPQSEMPIDEEQYGAEMDALNKLIDSSAVDTGIKDLAKEHNHYLYGAAKQSN